MMTTKTYPLFVEYRQPVVCNGFVAAVAVRGRVLLTHDGDEFWAYGVNPGGICASGDEIEAAVKAFYERFNSVLFDLADEGESFPKFKKAVETFVNGTNEPFETAWLAARQAVRKGEVDLPGMPRDTAEVGDFVRVVELKNPVASDNPPPQPRITLAALGKAA